MKRIITIIFFLSLIVTTSAQTQQGVVKTKGRLVSNGTIIAGTRLPGATITIRGGNAVVSGNKGTFSLAIPGNNYYLQNVQKQGYVLTDPDVLSKQYACSKNPLVLVLETPDQQADDRLAVEKKIRRTLQRQLQEKEDELDALKEQQKINEEEYREQLQEILSKQKNDDKLIGDMVDRYSKIDFDEVDEFNRRLSQLIFDGKLAEADSLINAKGDMNLRVSDLRQLHEANNQTEKKLKKDKELELKKRADIAQDCYSKFQIKKMQHHNDSAAYYIELRADLDTNNIEWCHDAGNFIAHYMADYDKAMSYFQRMITLSSNSQEKSSAWLGAAYLNIGGIFEEQGKYQQAIEFFEKALSTYRIVLGEQNLNIASCFSNIGASYSHIDKNKALQYYEKALEIRIANSGEESQTVANTYNNLGTIYSSLGNLNKASDYFHKALRIRLLEGNDTEAVAGSYHNIGSLLSKQELFEQALEYLEKALDINKKILGDHHPHLAALINNIGYIYSKKGEYEKALYYYQEALNIRTRILGEQHPDIATSYNNLALIYRRCKDYEKAILYYSKALEIRRNALGEENKTIGDCYNNIGSVYLAQGKNPKAIEFYLSAINVYKKTIGDSHPDIAVCYCNIARAYRNEKKLTQALEVSRKALNIMEKSDIKTSTLGIIYGTIGNILSDQGNYKEALDNLEKAKSIMESKLGSQHQTTMSIEESINQLKEKLRQ